MGLSSNPRGETPTLGILAIVASVFLLSLGDALVKRASAEIPLWELYVARGLIAVPILIALLLHGRRTAGFMPKSPGWVLLRSLLLVGMWIAYYAALPAMSLSVAAVGLYTAPLFIALFSARLIGEPVGPRRWAGILLGFAGVLVILRPAAEGFSVAALLPILAALCYALAAVVTRGKCAEERPLVLALALNLCLLAAGLLGAGLLALWNPGPPAVAAYPFLLAPWQAMGAHEWEFVVFLALLMVAVSTGVAKAYQSAPAAIIGSFDYAYLLFAALWSFVVFSEAPDGPTIAGMALIAAAGWLVLEQDRVSLKQAAP
jgi:drug/metabolite transporter (DMT)-like permease